MLYFFMNTFIPGNTVGSLTSIQHAVLVGSLLGDGTLRKQGTRTNALLEVNHSWQSKEYVDWKFIIFQSYVLTSPKRRLGNGNRVAYRFTTQSLPYFRYKLGNDPVTTDPKGEALVF